MDINMSQHPQLLLNPLHTDAFQPSPDILFMFKYLNSY